MTTPQTKSTLYAARRTASWLLARVGLRERAIRWYIARDRRRRGIREWPSETSKCRARLAPFCAGYGLDLGFGGDAILPGAIRVDLPQPYTMLSEQPVQLGGSADDLRWFRDGTLDYVFSSHLLEDFDDIEATVREWLRVLRPGGRLVLFCPDEQAYRAHCAVTGQPRNPYHKHDDFSLGYVKERLVRIGQHRIIHEIALIDEYSWELVCEKVAAEPEVV